MTKKVLTKILDGFIECYMYVIIRKLLFDLQNSLRLPKIKIESLWAPQKGLGPEGTPHLTSLSSGLPTLPVNISLRYIANIRIIFLSWGLFYSEYLTTVTTYSRAA